MESYHWLSLPLLLHLPSLPLTPSWQGEQCFKQALSLDSSHVPSLILYSTCCALDERFDEGETFLEMATAKDPNNAVAWTVTGEQ